MGTNRASVERDQRMQQTYETNNREIDTSPLNVKKNCCVVRVHMISVGHSIIIQSSFCFFNGCSHRSMSPKQNDNSLNYNKQIMKVVS